MRHTIRGSRWIVPTLTLLLIAVAATVAGGKRDTSWTRWGGPHQDFSVKTADLAESWPETGPNRLWSRELGDGYSAILAEGGRLYTMYRTDSQESVIALDASSGKTVWERRYDAGPKEGHVTQFGEGPRSTPLIVGDRLYAIGISGTMHCLNKKDGSIVWTQQLWDEMGGSFLNHGYSSSPIAYKKWVIALVGGEQQAVVAFDRKSGKPAWKSGDFKNSYSTPKIVNVDGREMLISFMADEVMGMDPTNGDVLWSHPHTNQWQQNVNMPYLAEGNILFISSPQAGAKGLKLSREGDRWSAEEVWSTRKIQFYHVTSVRDGDWVYGSTGMRDPAFMAAINIRTGEIGWRKRGFGKANVLQAGNYLIVLDEGGVLSLTTATSTDLEVHSQVELLDGVSWTVPTVVGTTMYVRDTTSIMALDLG